MAEWHRKYWDIVDRFYWVPSDLGLKSIVRKGLPVSEGGVCIPLEMLGGADRIYVRDRKIHSAIERLGQQEEILNNIFDISFAIAPDEVISRLLFDPLAIRDEGPFDSIGREIWKRFGWGEYENVTSPDGFIVSGQSIVAVELKLGAKSSVNQLAKYVALLVWEEMKAGQRENLGLLYITPSGDPSRLWAKGTEPEAFPNLMPQIQKLRLPPRINTLFEDHPDRLASVLERLIIKIISWQEHIEAVSGLRESLDAKDRGEQTLRRLLDGYYSQLIEHKKTGFQQAQQASKRRMGVHTHLSAPQRSTRLARATSPGGARPSQREGAFHPPTPAPPPENPTP